MSLVTRRWQRPWQGQRRPVGPFKQNWFSRLFDDCIDILMKCCYCFVRALLDDLGSFMMNSSFVIGCVIYRSICSLKLLEQAHDARFRYDNINILLWLFAWANNAVVNHREDFEILHSCALACKYPRGCQ